LSLASATPRLEPQPSAVIKRTASTRPSSGRTPYGRAGYDGSAVDQILRAALHTTPARRSSIPEAGLLPGGRNPG
jgi:hypothetical protein